MERYNIIVNPIAGGGKTLVAIKVVTDYLDLKKREYKVFYTKRRFHAKEIANELSLSGEKYFIIVGGDGTIAEVFNGIANRDEAVIGIIPAGTGNDFSRPLGIPLDYQEAIKFILENHSKPTDLMQVNDMLVHCFATCGIDIEIVKICNSMKKKTPNCYNKALLKALLYYKGVKFDLTANGKTASYNALLVGATNNGEIATGMKLCPFASVEDGIVDVVIIKYVNFFKKIPLLLSLKKGTLLGNKNVEHIKCASASIVIKNCPTLDLDGELYQNIPFELSVMPQILNIIRK
ncbi:MAG: diacylglycerol kinase family lipid kinase [Clostridia bacterium]